MAHPFNKFRQSSVERSRVGALTEGYKRGGKVKSDHDSDKKLIQKMVGKDLGDIGGIKAAFRHDRPRRASGGKVGKKATTVVNVITGGQQTPPAPPPMMPPPGAMGPPPGPPLPPGGPPPGAMGPPPGAGGPPPGMPMRARGGGVNKGTKVFEASERAGTKVQHDPAHEEVGKLNRPRVVTFAAGGGVVSFKAGGGRVPLPRPRPAGVDPQPGDLYAPDDVERMQPKRAKGGRITSPEKGGMGPNMHGGAGGAEGRLEKKRLY